MKIIFKNIQFEAVTGDIANQPNVEAVVNAANVQLQTGGGVAGAIHRAAGPELYNECRKLAPIKPGEAVITKAYNLANDYVIHCLGPVYGRDTPEDKLLTNCYKNALRLAEKHQIRSIACPDAYREGGAKSLTAMSGFLVFCILGLCIVSIFYILNNLTILYWLNFRLSCKNGIPR